jgi:aspartate-semialdehyde dehydrogenase
MWFVKNPEWFDVIVTDNMFGDIITDLGAMIQGGMGIAAGGNINPEGVSMFEPIGGSAPKYTGKNVINPLAAICAGGMLLDTLGEEKAAKAIESAVIKVATTKMKSLAAGKMGYSTTEVGDLVALRIKWSLAMSKKVNVAVMGATGAVGTCFLDILQQRKFPINSIKFLASERSKGKSLKFAGKDYPVEVLTHDSFKGIDIVLASAGASRSLEFLPSAVKAGAVSVDNSSAFRMYKDVPLVVPEVNARRIKDHKGIIANPNCSTIQMVVALAPIHKVAKIKRIVVTTFQSVSGAGQSKINELREQTKDVISGKKAVPKEFPYQIAFNLLPQIDVFLDNGYTKEEMKMVDETRKIMEAPDIQVNATCIRVPVFYAHSESVNIETEKPISPDEVRKLLAKAPGVKLVDDIAKRIYPMPIDAEGKDDTLVGRIRKDESVKNGISMWVVADNIRKGAALNAIQIAEELIK